MNNLKKKVFTVMAAYWPLIIILIVCAFVFTIQLNRDLLIDWDECVYAQQSKEMLATGNFLTNQWNRELVFEKPPLYNWLTVPFYALFGISPFTARIPMVIMGLSLIGAMYVFSKKYFNDKVAIMASLLFIASQLPITYIIRNNTDIGVALFVFTGVWAWIASYKNSKYSYLAGFLFACGVLMKGLGVLPYMATIAVSLLLDFKKPYVVNYFKMSGVFLLGILPWHIYHLITYGNSFFQVYILEHIVKRSQNTLDFHVEGRLFYIKLLIRNLGPWLVFIFVLPVMFALQVKKFLSKKALQKELRTQRLIITIALLVLFPLISITRVQTRIEWYALPIFPFLSVFIAYSIFTLIQKTKYKMIVYVVIAVLAIQSFYLIATRTRFWDGTRSISRAQEFLIGLNQFPEDNITYLVWHGERTAEAILPASMRTSTTFVYGGQPCAVYFSNKKIHYVYNMDEFKKRLQNEKGLFMLENSDRTLFDEVKGSIIYKNSDYSLFRKE